MKEKRQLYLTVEFQLINIEGMLEIKKKKKITIKHHSNNCFREEKIDAKINGKKYSKKQDIYIFVVMI